jgi:hypothetical protein
LFLCFLRFVAPFPLPPAAGFSEGIGTASAIGGSLFTTSALASTGLGLGSGSGSGSGVGLGVGLGEKGDGNIDIAEGEGVSPPLAEAIKVTYAKVKEVIPISP